MAASEAEAKIEDLERQNERVRRALSDHVEDRRLLTSIEKMVKLQIDRLSAVLDQATHERDEQAREVERMRAGWNADVDWANKLLIERDEARAEIERLREQLELRRLAKIECEKANEQLRRQLSTACAVAHARLHLLNHERMARGAELHPTREGID